MFDSEVDLLPDPDLFRDAVTLAVMGTFSPTELDATDALLLDLVQRLKKGK